MSGCRRRRPGGGGARRGRRAVTLGEAPVNVCIDRTVEVLKGSFATLHVAVQHIPIRVGEEGGRGSVAAKGCNQAGQIFPRCRPRLATSHRQPLDPIVDGVRLKRRVTRIRGFAFGNEAMQQLKLGVSHLVLLDDYVHDAEEFVAREPCLELGGGGCGGRSGARGGCGGGRGDGAAGESAVARQSEGINRQIQVGSLL